MKRLSEEEIKSKLYDIQILHPKNYIAIKIVLLCIMFYDLDMFDKKLDYYSSEESLKEN